MPRESGSSQQVGDPVSTSLCICSACPAPPQESCRALGSYRCGWGRPLVSPLGWIPQPLLPRSEAAGEHMQFRLPPLGAARRLWLVPPLKGPPTWQVFTFT